MMGDANQYIMGELSIRPAHKRRRRMPQDNQTHPEQEWNVWKNVSVEFK